MRLSNTLLQIFICTILLLNLLTYISAISISVQPTVITDPSKPLTVSWEGVSNASYGDVIMIYVVPSNHGQTYPIPNSYQLKHQIGFYKIYEVDSKFTGRGSVEVPIFAPRDHSFYFEYVRITLTSSEILTYSQLIPQDLSGLLSCTQFHLAPTHEKSNLILSYTTMAPANTKHWVHLTLDETIINTIQYKDITNTTINGFFEAYHTGTYTIDDMHNLPASNITNFIPPGNFRKALLFIPTTREKTIYYRIRDVDGNAQSKVYELHYYSDDSNKRYETDMYLFGDSGVGFNFHTTTDQQQTAAQTYQSIYRLIQEKRTILQDYTPTSILHNGDITYARGYAFLNEYFFQQIEPIASSYPYAISLGNHEYCYPGQPWHPQWHNCGNDSGGETITAFKRWDMPQDFKYTPYTTDSIDKTDQRIEEYKQNGMKNIAYSYNVGYVHVIVFTLELDFIEGSTQYNFLINDLEHIDRKVTPWVILAAHRPPYCTTQGCAITPTNPFDQSKSIDVILRRLIQPIMVKYNVNIGLWGHCHQYERFKLMGLDDYIPITTYEKKIEQYNINTNKYETIIMNEPVSRVINGIEHIKSIAPLHLLSGVAGNEYSPDWASYMIGVEQYSALHKQMPNHVQVRMMNFGFSHIRANQTHLVGKFYGSASGTLHDHFILELP